MSKLKVAVVGAGGFIGQHLTRRLLSMPGLEITTLGKGVTGKHPGTTYKQMDAANVGQMAAIFKGIDAIYYLASETIPATSWENPKLEVEKNLIPFLNFIEACSLASVKRIIFTSSAGTVYGPSTGKIREDQEKRPFSPYGIIKLCLENFLGYAESRHGILHDVYRVSNAYGEGQDTTKGLGLINTLIERIIDSQPIHIYGDGQTRRNFVYVGDVAELLVRSLENIGAPSGTYNLSSDDTLTVNEVVTLIKEIVKEDVRVINLPGRGSDVPTIDLDNSRLRKRFPGFDFTPFREGIQNTYTSLHANKIQQPK